MNKSKKKKETERKLERAKTRRLFWKIVQRQYPADIRRIDQQIGELEKRKAHLLRQIQIAPEEYEKADKYVCFLSEKRKFLSEDRVQKFMRLRRQLEHLEKELEDVKLTDEQLQLIQQASPASISL